MEGPKNYVHAADTSASEVRIAIEKYKKDTSPYSGQVASAAV
jgi:hypothetical protein